MAFLDWMNREGGKNERLDASPIEHLHLTKKGHHISVIGGTQWESRGSYEFRQYVGWSIEGYHGGLEVSYLGKDSECIWSNARPTLDRAENAAHRMGERCALEGGPEMERIANSRERYSESPNRHEGTPKEPDRSWER